MKQSSSSSSSSSSSQPNAFGPYLAAQNHNEMMAFSSMPIQVPGYENGYSKHSTWVHPAMAHQNQLLAGFMPKLSWRKGKWTEEEEIFTKKLIDAFNGGYLKVPSNTTLRSFLAERLCCDPMRITKKFAGSSCIGKQVCIPTDGVIDETKRKQIQDELKSLEEIFMAKVEYLHKLSHRPCPVPMITKIPIDGGHHILPPHVAAYPTLYYHSHSQPPRVLSQNQFIVSPPHNPNFETFGSMPRPPQILKGAYAYPLRADNLSGSVHGELAGVDNANFNQNPQLMIRKSQHHNTPKFPASAPVYRPRQAHTSADLFGRQYPTTIEQMTFLSSENLRRKLAADNTVPSNGFNAGGRMGMGDAAKFCSAAAHAYSERSLECGVPVKTHVANVPTAAVAMNTSSSLESLTSESSVEGRRDIKQLDLEASDLLLNFFNAAGTSSGSKGKEGSTCGSSASGSTSNPGEQDADDSAFSDVNDADVSASLSGRSSSLSSDRSDGNSDVDYSSPEETEHKLPKKTFYKVDNNKRENSFDNSSSSSEGNAAVKKQRISEST